jgi:hypothetical protein
LKRNIKNMREMERGEGTLENEGNGKRENGKWKGLRPGREREKTKRKKKGRKGRFITE